MHDGNKTEAGTPALAALVAATAVALAGSLFSTQGAAWPVGAAVALGAATACLGEARARASRRRRPEREEKHEAERVTRQDLDALLAALPHRVTVVRPGGQEILFETGRPGFVVPHLPLLARLAPEEGEARQIAFKHGGEDVHLSLVRRALRWGGKDAHLLVLADIGGVRQTEAERLRAARRAVIGEIAEAVMRRLEPPLAAIHRNAHDALFDLPPTEEVLRPRLTAILAEAERADRLAGRLSAMARLNGEIGRRRFVLAAGIEAGIRQAEQRIRLGGAVLLSDVEAGAGIACPGEEPAFAQALSAILTRSLQGFEAHAVPRGERHIRLEVRADGGPGRVRILVRDNAGGIEPSRLGTLFDPFAEPDGEDGLSLALAHRAIERSGGEIVVRNTASPFAKGRRGTSVEISLPADYFQGADLNQAVP